MKNIKDRNNPNNTNNEKNGQLETYREEKEELLKDFGIKLNREQRLKLISLCSETSIDSFVRQVITDFFDKREELELMRRRSKM